MSIPQQQAPWTDAQWAAIRHVAGDLLVSAAAGSGKTAVLAERCARLVCEEIDGGCGVEGLLVLTFTEAAANEMRGRIAEAIRAKLKAALSGTDKLRPDRIQWLQRQSAMVERAGISTLHAFCARVLRQHFHEARIDPAFELIDEDEARLLREEVLDEVLARWHADEIPDSARAAGITAERFADFFEAYGQGRDSHIREMILRVFHMLASAADPDAYLRKSRAVYSAAGSADMIARYFHDVVGAQLRLLAMTLHRAAADARRLAGPDAPITAGLEQMQGMLAWAQRELQDRGPNALPSVRDALSCKWPTLKSMKDVEGFDDLKKRTWEKAKEEVKKFCDTALANDPAAMRRDLLSLAGPLEVLLGLVSDFESRFTAAKRGQNRLDFSDLERLTLNLLTAPDSLAARELRTRYCHILVDEAQDINPLQDALLRAVRSADRFEGKGNLFVVGDVKQSIYGFRLADPTLFLAWERRATEIGEGHIRLSHNFRSQPKLLHAMNALFEKIMTPEVAGVAYTDGHALAAPDTKRNPLPSPEHLHLLDGSPVEVHLVTMDAEEDEPDDDEPPAENLSAIEEEARMVARRIAALLREKRVIFAKGGHVRPLACRDIAILLRSMKDRAMIFARALACEGIPVHADLATGYFDAPEVRDTLALLHVLDNPQQDIPLATVMLGPYGGFCHDDLARIRLAFDRRTVKFCEAVPRFAAESAAPQTPATEHDLASRLHAFLDKLDTWRDMLRTVPLHEGLAAIYSDSKILAYVSGLEAGEQRVANLLSLHQRALKFSGFSKQGLHRFLRFIEKLRDQEGDFGEAPVLSEASDVVRIMSVHKSKGLEFPVVIVAGLGGMFNLLQPGPLFVHRELGIGLHVADVERNVFYPSAASAWITEANKRSGRAEELRLLYVALTRARDHLLLTGHIDKTDALARLKNIWAAHDAPLPEDALLKARRSLDWLLPAIACSTMHIRWHESTPADEPQLAITLHPASGRVRADTSAESDKATRDELADRLTRGEPLPIEETRDEAVAGVIQRITGTYAFEQNAHRPAVQTVSALKEGETDESAQWSPFDPRPLRQNAKSAARAEEARLRGLATHRILELLDFTRCASSEEIETQITAMVADQKLLQEDFIRADRTGICWFLLETTVGKRIVAAAQKAAAGETHVHLRREIPFTWAAPFSDHERTIAVADWATVRGTIDLLHVDLTAKQAEIIDYKTDSAFIWHDRIDEYRRQVTWYLRAAAEILGFPPTRATIIFLTPRQCIEVQPTP